MRRAIFLLALSSVISSACGLKVPADSSSRLSSGEGAAVEAAEAGAEGASVSAEAGGAQAGGAAAAAGGPAAKAAAGKAGEGPAGVSGAKLFPNDTEGVTDTQVTICSHIPMTGAAPIPRHPGRFGKFYFDYVNKELKGIHGRNVKFVTLDDKYYPAGALQAVNDCKRNGTFLYAGAAGTDQIVAVGKWAAANKVPYLAGPASVKDIGNIPQVKMVGPDYESQHVLLADYLIKNAQQLTGKAKPVFGMLRVNSPFFTAGHDVFVEELRKRGFSLAVDKQVEKDENQFTDVMLEMEQKGVDIINNFTTPNIWIKLLKQNNNPNYKPLFTAVSPAAGYNIIAAALADSNAKAILFHHFNPPYDHTDRNLPWAGDITEFRRIFDKYSPEKCEANDPLCPDDFDYSAYLAAKGLERILRQAGRDLTRTKVWTLLDTYKENPAQVGPACALDFTRDKGRGAHAVNVYRLDGAKWKLLAACIDRV
ncbi:MAG TPA: ABC transporter substrate-binding protein [Actinomycetota bacterium]|nr:ABC transporter substrate-binding protein [Actinomycetota bacterium]